MSVLFLFLNIAPLEILDDKIPDISKDRPLRVCEERLDDSVSVVSHDAERVDNDPGQEDPFIILTEVSRPPEMVQHDNSRDCHDQDDTVWCGKRVRHQGEEAVVVPDQELVTTSRSSSVVSVQMLLSIVNPVLQPSLGNQSTRV